MTNVVGLQTDDAGNIGQNSSTHVARVVGLQTEAVVVTETRLIFLDLFNQLSKIVISTASKNIKEIHLSS